MRKFLLIFSFLILSLETPSACFRYFVVEAAPAYSDFDALLKAVSWVESRDYDLALNISEQSVGRLQIRACRIEHYNKLTGKDYSHADCFDYAVSREVFLYFAQGKSWKQAAKSWNGAGPMTEVYWKKVRVQL